MPPLPLHDLHADLCARFSDFNGSEYVESYGDVVGEFRLLQESSALIDLGFRSRLCVIGPDRVPFLHGQVTNDIRKLKPGEGCLAALVDHKGKILSDLSVHRLNEELLLDFEPGLTERVSDRLNQFIIAEDVEIVDVAPHYGLLSVQGPKSSSAVESLNLGAAPPSEPRQVVALNHDTFGEIYLVNRARTGQPGFELYVPTGSLKSAFEALLAAVNSAGGDVCGDAALEQARILAGIPRYGVDMDESNLVSETGIAEEAISYSKGCYIGQEVIARIRTYGRAKRRFCRLTIETSGSDLPANGDLLHAGERKAGWITSATCAMDGSGVVALGYVSADFWDSGTPLTLKTKTDDLRAVVA